jgi:transcription-repair coupling factor (superfamily II helicase)
MASDRPMDRLVCGDVGFGKTEVAIRAAFKCTQHTRQVAVLVPTTILVDQHRANFVRRFEGYPIKVGAVSRFYSPTENQRTLRQVASGEIDIVIGTHRLLQADVSFHDLGLVIIDEEHRFGVKQKERLKQMRQQVDVLTLTATPIPRTLHMSLLGIRDVSTIMTPPTDRRAVKTFIAERDDEIIRDALLREIRRGGQAFFLHNRVNNIEAVTNKLATLVPEARFDFAHGQMSEHLLEEIMHRFIEHKFDVLVTTTIIESGLDIPNANTMIIDRSDQFGLAQLYQLRGRVGRSSRQAYTYLLVGSRKNLGSDAQKRLKVLQSLDDLGVGFNLAVRDLEIRGAGNLLGKEQSGSVLSVGYDTYCKILQEAVAHLRGTDIPLEDAIDPEVKIAGLDAFIPEPYIPDVSERLVTYQRLAGIRSDDEAFELQREMEDRFGPLLPPIERLLHLMRFRSLLRAHGVVKAESNALKTTLTFSPNTVSYPGAPRSTVAVIDGAKVTEIVKREPHRYRFSRNFSLSILWPAGPDPEIGDVFVTVKRLLETVRTSPLPGLN